MAAGSGDGADLAADGPATAAEWAYDHIGRVTADTIGSVRVKFRATHDSESRRTERPWDLQHRSCSAELFILMSGSDFPLSCGVAAYARKLRFTGRIARLDICQALLLRLVTARPQPNPPDHLGHARTTTGLALPRKSPLRLYSYPVPNQRTP